MSTALRLVIFDVDGTLVDSQGDIVAAMTLAFDAVGQAAPARAVILSIVGLSLHVAMERLAPDLEAAQHRLMVEAYKDSYMTLRARTGAAQSSPLYPGALDALRLLRAQPDTLLGIATGKSKRGLDKLIEAHDLQGHFITQQVADTHPSKPNPSMIFAAMRDTGVDTENTVMIGDTTFDMEMATAAGVPFIGVSWGYHRPETLHGAARLIKSFEDLPGSLEHIWRQTA